MAEPTLSLALTDLQEEAGGYLGWGRTTTAYSADQSLEIKRLVESALRKFYFAAAVSPGDPPYTWSFLRPVATVQLATGNRYADLPADFGGFTGQAAVRLAGAAGGYWPVKVTTEENIRIQYAAITTQSARPLWIAESQVKGTGPQTSNRVRLQVYPLPDADYALEVPYFILPDFLTAANPYHYGGAAHAETMKAGVRAAAERYLDNMSGPEEENYRMLLAASVQFDRRHQPQTLGLNVDASDFLRHRGNWPNGLYTMLGVGNPGIAAWY